MIKVKSTKVLAITEAPKAITYIINRDVEIEEENYDFLQPLEEEERAKQMKKYKNQLLRLHQINPKKIQVTEIQVEGHAAQRDFMKSSR